MLWFSSSEATIIFILDLLCQSSISITLEYFFKNLFFNFVIYKAFLCFVFYFFLKRILLYLFGFVFFTFEVILFLSIFNFFLNSLTFLFKSFFPSSNHLTSEFSNYVILYRFYHFLISFSSFWNIRLFICFVGIFFGYASRI